MFSDAWTAQTQDPNHFFGLGIIVSKASKSIYVNAEDNCEERKLRHRSLQLSGDMTYLGKFFQAKFKIV